MYECEIEILMRCQKSLMCEKGHGLEQEAASLTVTSITWKFRHGSNDPLLGYGPWPWPLKCEGQENVNLFWQLAERRRLKAAATKFDFQLAIFNFIVTL